VPQEIRKTAVDLYIPSILGYEKVAMDTAASLARELGFSNGRVADLRTAVGEACLNAIEHGNQQDASAKVMVTLMADSSGLQVEVVDKGRGLRQRPEVPRIEEKLAGKEASRGWGIFLIQKLVDEATFEQIPAGGNRTRLVIHLRQ
jgi:serine/threonine-protein kinase RsbW